MAIMFPRIFPSLILLTFVEIMMLGPGASIICEAPSKIYRGSMCSGKINKINNIICVSICQMEGFDNGECKVLQCMCKKACEGDSDGDVPAEGPSSSSVSPVQSLSKDSGGNIFAQGPFSGCVNPFQGPQIISGGYDPAQSPSLSGAIPGQGSPNGNDPTRGPIVDFVTPVQGPPMENGGIDPAQDPIVDFAISTQGQPMECWGNDPAQDPIVDFVILDQVPPMESEGNDPAQGPSNYDVDPVEVAQAPLASGDYPAQGPPREGYGDGI